MRQDFVDCCKIILIIVNKAKVERTGNKMRQWLQKLSMRYKLIICFVVVGVLPLVVASGITAYLSHQKVVSDAYMQNQQVAVDLAEQFNHMLSDRVNVLKVVAQTPEMMSMDPARQQSAMLAVAKQFPDMTSIIIAGMDGQQIYRTEGSLANVADRAYFQTVKNGAPFAVSEVLIAKGTGRPSVILAVPVHNAQGMLTEVLMGVLDLQHVSDTVGKIKLGQTGYIFVTDSAGRIVAHPDKDMVQQQSDVSGIPAVRQALAGGTGAISYDWHGARKIAGYSVVSLAHWAVVAQVPESEALAAANKVKLTSFLLVLLAIFIAVAASLLFARLLTRPIQALVEASQAIAAGDLSRTVPVDSQDEMGRLSQAFNVMVENLRGLVRQVMSTGEQVAASAQELSATSAEAAKAVEHIATTSSDLAAGAQTQSQEMTATVQSVTALSASAQAVAQKAGRARKLAETMAQAAQQGGQAALQAEDKIQEVDAAVRDTSTVVKELGAKSQEIGTIVDTITAIAGQTNLLALNAAIEAARAGEQGRGFAVVAEEVRKLAEQSQEAAKQIAAILGDIRSRTEQSVAAMDSGLAKVDEGVDVVRQAGKALENIAQQVATSVEMIQAIAEAADEQDQEMRQMLERVHHVSDIAHTASEGTQSMAAATEETTASMEEISAAAQALAGSATELQNMIAKFKL